MILLLLGSSEASPGLLRSVSWAAQKAPKTLENAVFELPDGSGRAAALPGPRRMVPGGKKHPSAGLLAARIGMIWARTSEHPSCLATLWNVISPAPEPSFFFRMFIILQFHGIGCKGTLAKPKNTFRQNHFVHSRKHIRNYLIRN